MKVSLCIALAVVLAIAVAPKPAESGMVGVCGVLQLLSIPVVNPNCSALFTCTGTGSQLYTCNGTTLTGIGSNVKLTCDGAAKAGTYVYNNAIPTYTLACGSVQANPYTQLRIPNPTGIATDSTLYRRAAYTNNATGCLTTDTYIARVKATGGLQVPPTCTAAQKGKIVQIAYTGTWQFLAC